MKLGEARTRELYDELIRPGVFQSADARPGALEPAAVLSAGQPGSGRDDNIRAIRNEFASRGGLVIVDPDALQAQHPDARTASPAEIRKDVGAFMQQALTDAVRALQHRD